MFLNSTYNSIIMAFSLIGLPTNLDESIKGGSREIELPNREENLIIRHVETDKSVDTDKVVAV